MKLIFDIGNVVVDLAQPLFLDFPAGIATEHCCENRIGNVVCDLDLSVVQLGRLIEDAP